MTNLRLRAWVYLIDLETGEEPVAGLKFAFWVR